MRLERKLAAHSKYDHLHKFTEAEVESTIDEHWRELIGFQKCSVSRNKIMACTNSILGWHAAKEPQDKDPPSDIAANAGDFKYDRKSRVGIFNGRSFFVDGGERDAKLFWGRGFQCPECRTCDIVVSKYCPPHVCTLLLPFPISTKMRRR